MAEETYSLIFQGNQYTIVTPPMLEPYDGSYKIWKNGNYYFSVVPYYDGNNLKWKDKNTLSAINDELMKTIVQAINDHNL